MPTLFTRIIDGEIPGVFVWRDPQCVVFLSINPMHPGHALVVPRAEVDHWIDLDPALAAHLFQVAQTIGQAQQAAMSARRIGMMIVGDEVPHVHLHVVPFDSVSELSFAHADPNPPEGSLDAAAAKIRAALRDLGADAVSEQARTVGRHDEWVARDAAVVWHGFTQMDAYAENAPILVERGEGHELIDVDGRRYLDAISSLWVNTLGHHVPELDDAVRAQLDRGAHSTMLGNGNVVVVELAEALARVVPVDDPHFLFASDGAAAVEQALKIAFQYWVNRGITGHTQFLAFGGAYHGDTLGALSVGDASFGTDLFDPLRFPVLRAPQFGEPGCFDTAIAMVETHASELAAVIVEPLVQGAAGMLLADADGLRALGAACRAHGVLLICDEVATGFGRTGTLFASEQCGLRPDLLVVGKGLTAGYLPMSATVASGAVFDAFLGPDLSARTLYHGHSYSGNALAAAVALRHLELLDAWSVLEHVQARSRELRELLDDRVAPHPAVREVRLCGLMGGVELAPPADDLRWGRRVCAEAVARGVLLRPLGDVVVLMPPLTVTSEELHQIVHALTGALDEVSS